MTVTLITGGTRGLGREAARRLVDAGHTVFLGARDPLRGSQVATEVGAVPITLDVTQDASIRGAAQRVSDEAGHLDVLMNNAGIAGAQQPPDEATINDLRLVCDTNIIGAVNVLATFTPLLELGSQPVVVNVSSAVGSLALNAGPDVVWSSMLAYPMSKAALNMLTVQYARAFPRWRVNSVTPGITATDFSPASNLGGGTVEDNVEVMVRMAMIGSDGPTGTFVGNDGPLPW